MTYSLEIIILDGNKKTRRVLHPQKISPIINVAPISTIASC